MLAGVLVARDSLLKLRLQINGDVAKSLVFYYFFGQQHVVHIRKWNQLPVLAQYVYQFFRELELILEVALPEQLENVGEEERFQSIHQY